MSRQKEPLITLFSACSGEVQFGRWGTSCRLEGRSCLIIVVCVRSLSIKSAMSMCLSNRGLFLLSEQEDLCYTQSISDLISEDCISLSLSLQPSLAHTFSDTHFLFSFSCSYIWFSLNSCSHDFAISLVHRDTHIQILPLLPLRSFHILIYIREVVFQELSLKPP